MSVFLDVYTNPEKLLISPIRKRLVSWLYIINNNHNSDIVQSQGFKHRITEMEKMEIFRLIFWDVYFA